MGGRGASSGVSDGGKAYGSQYHTILETENIKFVSKKCRQSESLMETMTEGRIYVTVGNKDLLSIMYFDDKKRVKAIDLDHMHDKVQPHTHHGYFHAENDRKKGYAPLTDEERAMVEKVKRIWYNHLSR